LKFVPLLLGSFASGRLSPCPLSTFAPFCGASIKGSFGRIVLKNPSFKRR